MHVTPCLLVVSVAEAGLGWVSIQFLLSPECLWAVPCPSVWPGVPACGLAQRGTGHSIQMATQIPALACLLGFDKRDSVTMRFQLLIVPVSGGSFCRQEAVLTPRSSAHPHPCPEGRESEWPAVATGEDHTGCRGVASAEIHSNQVMRTEVRRVFRKPL